jgi:hypothetical protein
VTPLTFRDADGARHEVIVRHAPTGEWQVLDTCAGGTYLIETLDGSVDEHAQAEAVARDYAGNVQRLEWAPGRAAAEPIPEQGGVDAHSDRRPRSAPRHPHAGAAALPHPAG